MILRMMKRARTFKLHAMYPFIHLSCSINLLPSVCKRCFCVSCLTTGYRAFQMFVHWIPCFRQLRMNYNMFSQPEWDHWYPTSIFVFLIVFFLAVFQLFPILTSFNNWKSSVNVENMHVGNLVEKLHKSY